VVLSRNPNPRAIHLLKHNLDKINWFNISSNPYIFEDIIQQIYIENQLQQLIIHNI